MHGTRSIRVSETVQLILCHTVEAKSLGLEADGRIQLLAGRIQHHEAVAATCCTARTAGCCACGGFIQLRGWVEAGSQRLFEVRIRLFVWSGRCRIGIAGLPGGVGTELNDVAIHQLQCGAAASGSEELFTCEQLVAFEDLAFESVHRDGENLANDALDDGDNTHGFAP